MVYSDIFYVYFNKLLQIINQVHMSQLSDIEIKMLYKLCF